MTFLRQLDQSEIGTGTYYRIRNDKTIELGYENTSSQKEYDNTRLIIDPTAMIIEGQEVFKCKVSWFSSNDRVSYSENSIYDEKTPYNIIVEFNIEKLLTNKEYYSFFMSELLDKERVLKYLEQGMENNSEFACGDYIGYIDYNDKGNLTRYFDKDVGHACHYLPEKVEERNKKTIYKNEYSENRGRIR